MKNKYQEALNYFLDREEGENITVTCDWLLYAEELQELVDKETPMKPRKSKTDIWQSSNYCDVCGSFVGTSGLKYRQSNYCSGCGQKIDWREE